MFILCRRHPGPVVGDQTPAQSPGVRLLVFPCAWNRAEREGLRQGHVPGFSLRSGQFFRKAVSPDSPTEYTQGLSGKNPAVVNITGPVTRQDTFRTASYVWSTAETRDLGMCALSQPQPGVQNSWGGLQSGFALAVCTCPAASRRALPSVLGKHK